MRTVEVTARCISIEIDRENLTVILLVERGEFAGGKIKIVPKNHTGEGKPEFVLGAEWTGILELVE